MQKATQKNNIISIETTLGKDKLYLTEFSAHEAMSEIYSFNAVMYTVGTQISLEKLVGTEVTVALRNTESSADVRYFHGVISYLESKGMRTSASDVAEQYIDYHATIVPAISFLKKRTNCRIYQNKTSLKIVSELLNEHKVAFKDQTTKSYEKNDYCVQYQESDLDFIDRLLQQEGIFYFFEHTKSSHTLILVDDVTAYKKCDEEKVKCFSGSIEKSHISQWQGALSMVSGAYQQQGYDFEQPAKLPNATKVNAQLPSQSNYEVFDYAGEAEINKRSQSCVENQLEAIQKDMHKSTGQSDCRSFSVGKYFTFSDHEDSRYIGKSYLLTGIHIIASQPNQSGASQSSNKQVYINHFDCVPKETAYRCSQYLKKPLISGVQTAIVTGDPGDEQHIDKFGRVKVQFHWDREGEFSSKSSCWIRVAQNWAGNKWGSFFFPRVGQEVLVDFINGDPDQPMISGAVYNADLMPPYALPDKKSSSGIKSHSTKKGGADNFNEIRFDDEKGQELLFFQAEKDHELKIKNDQRAEIGNDYLINVINDEISTIGNDSQSTIANDQLTTVNNDRQVKIANNDTLDVGKVLNIKAGSEITFKTGGATIKMSSDGTINLEGKSININGKAIKIEGSAIALKAGQIKLN